MAARYYPAFLDLADRLVLVVGGGKVAERKVRGLVEAGARVSNADQTRLYPNFEQDPIGAIESEIFLMQAVRGERIDPYYAFRLGLLGKLVAQSTAPLANIRSKPDPSAPVLSRVVRGTRLQVVGKQENWLKLKLRNGNNGWVHSRLVQRAE